jgi:hypothetical protein
MDSAWQLLKTHNDHPGKSCKEEHPDQSHTEWKNKNKVRLVKSKEDAPDYRCPADDPDESCGNCKHWVKKSGNIGRCRLFDFQCNAKCVCDAWGGK